MAANSIYESVALLLEPDATRSEGYHPSANTACTWPAPDLTGTPHSDPFRKFERSDWLERYESRHTPWDLDGPHPELAARLAKDLLGRRRLGSGPRALVPGCGRGHDALALAQAGWAVTAVDLVAELGVDLAPRLEALGGRFLALDALQYVAKPPFELLWEHTFFCTLTPDQRPLYGEMARRLVGYRGRLMALLFPLEKPRSEGGPPYRTTAQDLAEALGQGFRLLRAEAVENRVARRHWGEAWAVFERLDNDDE